MTRKPRETRRSNDTLETIDNLARPDECFPSGLFKTSNGNSFLLTVEDECLSFAIALKHKTQAPFMCRKLKTSTFPKGVQLGDCEINLTHQCVYNVRRRPIGTLGINGQIISMLCRYRKGVEWITIGHLDAPLPTMEYDGWQFVKDGEVFFEQAARHNAWPEPLQFNIAHPPWGRDSLIEVSNNT